MRGANDARAYRWHVYDAHGIRVRSYIRRCYALAFAERLQHSIIASGVGIAPPCVDAVEDLQQLGFRVVEPERNQNKEQP